MPRGIYECVNCAHREVLDTTEPILPRACPKCGGDMILVGYSIEGSERQDKVETASAPTEGTTGAYGPLSPEVESKLSEFYSLRFEGFDGRVAAFEVLEIYEKNFERVLGELEELGYWAALKKRNGKIVLFIFPAVKEEGKHSWLPWILLLATVGTTFLAGYYQAVNFIWLLDYLGIPGLRNPYLIALSFSVSVLAILGTHELAHKTAATLHGVRATVPYFIPFPNIIGTLGALIRVKSPVPTRDAAIDLGVSGPIAGFLVAIPVTLIGIKLSVLVPPSALPSEGGIAFGSNLFFYLLMKLSLSQSGDYVLYLHPMAIAGWVGILVTFLNLIPAAQLDGGHIARAFMSERTHRYFTLALGVILVAMGILWVGWTLWGMLVLLMGSAGNPGALDEVSPVSKKRLLLVVVAIVIFVLSATPVPFSLS